VIPEAIVMRTAVIAAILTIVTALSAGSSEAQTSAGTVYVEGGAIFPYQSGAADEQSVTYVTAPGGLTFGWAIGGGVQVGRRASIHAELASTGSMTAREPSRYGMVFNEERRDRFLSIGLRLALPVSAVVHLEPFAGIVATFPEAWSQVDYVPIGALPPPPPAPRVSHDLETSLGPAFGLDARIGSRAVSVVPSFRLLRTAVSSGRYDDTSPPVEISSIYPGGYPEWTVRPGVSVRLRF
jgi:hypothetical protein